MSATEPKRERAAADFVRRYRQPEFFVLRTPLLPVADFATLGAGFGAASAAFDGGGTDPQDQLRKTLSGKLGEPHVADALRVASPRLADIAGRWREQPPSRRRDRLDRTLVQYFARMCDRCTPFGLFAGVSVGSVGGKTRLRLGDTERYRRRSTLDLKQIARLVRRLLTEPTVRKNIRYRANDTLAVVDHGYQYLVASERDEETRHEIALLEVDAALTAALAVARDAPRPLSEFRASIVARIADPEVGQGDIEEYLDDLIEAQILVPELVPAVVGVDPLNQILASLDRNDAPSVSATFVRGLREELDRLDAHGVGAPEAAYAAVKAVWTESLGLADTDRLLQVDMFKEPVELRLSEDIVEEVLRGVEPLWRLQSPVADPLLSLKNRFRERFELQEVSLAEAFDPERGLGVPSPDLSPQAPDSPLLTGLGLGSPYGDGRQAGGVFWDALAARLGRPCGEIPAAIDLDDTLLGMAAPRAGDVLPDALAIHFDLVAKSEKAVAEGSFRVFYHGALGPSGARMLGRFCDLDPVLLEQVRGHLRAEEALAPDEIFAEIVHSPEGRLGNVVRRPHIRRVELSCAGHSRREGGLRLTVDDLLLSLHNGRFLLRSRRDGRLVRPRLTSAHNFRRSSGIYRFLCALQNDGTVPGFGWNWGSLNGLPFLPRVTHGRAVYAVARWKVGRERPAYEAIRKARTPAARAENLAVLLKELRLPRFVRLREGDNRLLVDLDNPLCRSVLTDHIARSPSLIIEETLTEDLEGCVSGPEGKYRNEIILPLVRRQPIPSDLPEGGLRRRNRTPASVRRTYAPGDDWLFYKLYAAPGTADRLLDEIVVPLAAMHRELAHGEPWFFIRYSDPDPHLRVRFRAAAESRRALADRADSLLRPFVAAGSVHRVTVDTYVREVERYGGERGIELAEEWFRHDSAAALRIVALVGEADDERLRWKAVAMGFDRMLADFGLDHESRERVTAAARDVFGREFGVGPAVRRGLAKRLRAERPELLDLVRGGSERGILGDFEAVLRERSVNSACIVREFRRLEETEQLACPLDDLLRSLTHMHANRILPASARAHELVIHDFLSRTYRSFRAQTEP